MKKAIALILIAVCLSAVSCKAKELNGTIDQLFEKISKVNAEGELFAYDSDRLYDELLISNDLYSEGYFMIPVESNGVETIAFFKATNKENAKKLLDAFSTYIKDKQTYEEQYNADNYEVAKKAVAKSEGLYVYLVMSPNKTAVFDVINDNLK